MTDDCCSSQTCSVDVKTCSLLPIGSTCSADSTCDSFFCSQGSTCAPVTTAVNDGDHCLFSSMCSSPSTCGCRTPVRRRDAFLVETQTDALAFFQGCASTDDYICTPPAKLAIGIACGFDSDCDSAFCFSSSCTDPNGFTAKEGEHCLAADQCASGSTCECNTGGVSTRLMPRRHAHATY